MNEFKNKVQFHPKRSSHSRSRQKFSPYHKPLLKEKHYKLSKQNKEKLTLHEPIIKVRQLIEGKQSKIDGRFVGQRLYESNSGGSATNFSNCNFHSPFQTFDSQNYNEIICKIDQQSEIFKQHLSQVSRQLRLPKISTQEQSPGLVKVTIEKYEENQGKILKCLEELNKNNHENQFLKNMVAKYQEQLLHLRDLLEKKQQECQKLHFQILQLEKVIAMDNPVTRRKCSDQNATLHSREGSKRDIVLTKGSHTEIVRIAKTLSKKEMEMIEGKISIKRDTLFSENEGQRENMLQSVESIGDNFEFIEQLKKEITQLKLQNDLLNQEIKLLNQALNERDAKILLMKTSSQSEERAKSLEKQQEKIQQSQQPLLLVTKVKWSQSSRQVEDRVCEQQQKLNEFSIITGNLNNEKQKELQGQVGINSRHDTELQETGQMYESMCGRKKTSSFIADIKSENEQDMRKSKRTLSLRLQTFLDKKENNLRVQQQRREKRSSTKKHSVSKFKKINMQSDYKKMNYAKSFLKIRTRESFLVDKNKNLFVRDRKEIRFYDNQMIQALSLIKKTMTARCQILRRRYVEIQADLLSWGSSKISQKEMRQFLEEHPFFLNSVFIENLLRFILKELYVQEEQFQSRCEIEMDSFCNSLREFIEDFEMWDQEMEVIMSEKIKTIVIEREQDMMLALLQKESGPGVVGSEQMRRVLQMFKFSEVEIALVINQCCLISADIEHLMYQNYFSLFRDQPEKTKLI